MAEQTEPLRPTSALRRVFGDSVCAAFRHPLQVGGLRNAWFRCGHESQQTVQADRLFPPIATIGLRAWNSDSTECPEKAD